MMSNALSDQFARIPTWILQVLLGISLTVAIGWASWTTTSTLDAKTQTMVVRTQVDDMGRDVAQIKKDTEWIKAYLIERKDSK